MNFSVKNITKPTPLWAKNVFRVCLFVSGFAGALIPSLNFLTEDEKQFYLSLIPGFNFLVYNISKMFGIDRSEIESEQ